MFLLAIISTLFMASASQLIAEQREQKEIVVVIASYKNAKYYKKNLDSVFTQKYDNFHVIYIDDCSPDSTGNLVHEYIQKCGQEHRVTLIQNKERLGALANIYNAIQACDDNVIIATLDGDDWFANPNVLTTLNKQYSRHDIWLTYGQYKRYPRNKLGYCRELPQWVIDTCAYREYEWSTSHLRTFYAWLFKQIKLEDLMHEGKFFTMTWDKAFMLPMLEMAGPRSKFIADILYVYNMDNVINDFKVDRTYQEKLEKLILEKPKYALLASKPE